MNKPQMYTLNYNDPKILKKYYMPFIKNGGIFIETKAQHAMGEKINIKLMIPKEPEKFLISGSVVWINPELSKAYTEQGIGVQFESDNALIIKEKIETCLETIPV